MYNSREYYNFGQEIIDIIKNNQNPQIMLSRLAEKLGVFCQANACIIMPETDQIELEETGFWCDGQEQNLSQLLNEEVLVNIKPFTIKDITFKNKDSYKKTYEIDLSFQGKNNGKILFGYNRIYHWKKSEAELLKYAAETIALALKIVKLSSQLDTSARYQNLLEEISRKFRQSSDMDSILHLALAESGKTLNVDRGLILRFKYKEPLLKFKPDRKIEGKAEIASLWKNDEDSVENLQKESFDLLDSELCQVAWQNAPTPLSFSTRTELSSIINVDHNPSIFQLQTMEAISIVPLIGSYSNLESNSPVILGLLILQNKKPRVWQTNEIDLVKLVAIQASTSLIHHQTLQRVQGLVEERTTQLRLSLEVQAKLSKKMRHHIEELERLNQVKDKFVATLSDNLRHPLAKIKMGIQMLKIAPEGIKRDRYLEILESECAKEINLVDDLLTLQELESKNFQTSPQQLKIKGIIDELSSLFEQEWSQKALTLTTNYQNLPQEKIALLTIYTDSESLLRILRELFHNAGKFSDANTTVSVDVTTLNDGISIAITNIGLKISPEEKESIFEPFHRGINVTDGSNQGTGLGLALVKSLVEYLNGAIDISSFPLENSHSYITCFTLTLPQFQSQPQ